AKPGAWEYGEKIEQETGRIAAAIGSLAMILVMYAYGGWNDSAFVAAEVRNPRRNIPRALFIGVSLITLIYVAVNVAYINCLGWDSVSTFNPVPVPRRVIENVDVASTGLSFDAGQ